MRRTGLYRSSLLAVALLLLGGCIPYLRAQFLFRLLDLSILPFRECVVSYLTTDAVGVHLAARHVRATYGAPSPMESKRILLNTPRREEATAALKQLYAEKDLSKERRFGIAEVLWEYTHEAEYLWTMLELAQDTTFPYWPLARHRAAQWLLHIAFYDPDRRLWGDAVVSIKERGTNILTRSELEARLSRVSWGTEGAQR